MRADWTVNEGNDSLLVVVMGWAGCPHTVAHLRPRGNDVLCLYDWRGVGELIGRPSGELLPEAARYRSVHLAAWSFGVWVAERLFAPVVSGRAVALCGTPFPMDDATGLCTRRVRLTIKGLASGGKITFDRTSYGNCYERFSSDLAGFDADHAVQELSDLAAASSAPYRPSIDWAEAIAGTRDVIFRPGSMREYWGDKCIFIDSPHYPFTDAGFINGYFENR